ncbi:MAG TPA: radical SAM protein, partial [Spirochaetota bacterium]|nr:radical SAM protein [Spirochaetota bacterium]
KYPIICLYTSRGCPMGCAFCTVTKYFGSSYRTRPVEHVLAELDAIDANDYFIIDDNIIFNADYSRELFAALSKRNIHWMGQFSSRVLKNPDLIELAARSGCYDAFIGMESINKESLAGVKKSFNQTEEYEELFKRLMHNGIMPTVSVILGFDEDDAEQFRLTLEFLRKNGIFYAIFFILTPAPGTELYNAMSQEGRLLHRNWSLYNGTNVVFKPKKLTEAELLEEYWKTFQEFYSIKNICSHMVDSLNVRHRRISSFADNLAFQFYFRYMVKRRTHPYSCFGGRVS